MLKAEYDITINLQQSPLITFSYSNEPGEHLHSLLPNHVCVWFPCVCGVVFSVLIWSDSLYPETDYLTL